MSSPLVTIGLTYDDVDIQVFEGIWLEIVRGLFETADVRGVDVTVPGRNGQWARPRRFHQRKVLLAGFVRGDGDTEADRQSDFRGKCDILVALFDEMGPPKDLVVLCEDGSERTLACRTIPDGRIIVEEAKSEYGTISIEMVALEDWDVGGDE